MASIAQALFPRSMPAAIAAGRGVPPPTPFVWQGNQAVSAAELERQRKISDALRPTTAPTGPWSLLGDLADEGVASYRDSKASDAEKAAQQTVADALAKGDYQSVIANDMATPQQSAVAQALWQQKKQEDDPLRKLQIEQAQLDLTQDRDTPPKPLVVSPGDVVLDPKTNQPLYSAPPKDDGLGSDVDAITDSIISGDQPPVLTGLYKYSGPVRAGLAKKGYDFTKANQDWTATQKLLSTMNGPTQVRLRQAVNQVDDSLPLIEGLAKQWKGGNFPLLNKANIALAKGGAYGPDAQSLATQLDGEIADVAAELATVYRGGNTATDSALEQAGKQFSADWSENTLLNAIQLAKTNVAYRKNSLNLATAGIPDSQYNPMREGPADQPAVGPAGVTSAAPADAGAQDYPEGTVIEDGNGKRLVLKGGQWVPVQ